MQLQILGLCIDTDVCRAPDGGCMQQGTQVPTQIS